MKLMKTLTAAMVAVTVAMTPVVADTITIFTGAAGGGYDGRAQVIAQRLEQRGFDVVVENRNGSDEITLNACSARTGPVMWIAQKDAIWAREMQDGCRLVDVALYGNEYGMLFFPPGARNGKLRDLGASDTVLVDRVGSGSELTWRTMANIEREARRSGEWANAKTSHDNILRASSMATRGTIQAVFLVRTLQSTDIDMMFDQGWSLGEMWSRPLDDLEWAGQSLYSSERMEIFRNNRRVARDYMYEIPSFIGTTEWTQRNATEIYNAMISASQP